MNNKTKKPVSGSSVSQEPAIPAGLGSARKIDKRTKYLNKMTEAGYVRIHPYVHKDDKQKVLNYVEELRKNR